ncbi:acyl-CoA dehydrogenase [Azohydromonas caseinilytica]|uniref:Acyl-CoA dehydrogenase n=1 Tax=Azohydromonas caseinilytica TaxID=2728836 RepID=A0A848FFN6_9BURK|nr:acyl-CoA dehydrogenase [Azohydromonas caseinilytica]NML17956.1 acyl-CoA dehydrogenase [Azohydromonas caseinilytica]
MPITDDDIRLLRDAAPEAEALGRLAPVQLELIERRGWWRLLAPRALGGAELALPQAVRLEQAIAEADGSCGWVVTLCAGAGWFAGFLAPALAREVVATPGMCLAGSGAATGVAERTANGWRIEGRWGHATGAPHATHFSFNAVLQQDGRALRDASGAPRVRAFIVPAAGVRVLETWQAIGLRASASHAFEIHGLTVPDSHAFDIDPAAATQPGALYRFPFGALAYATLAANLGGMARSFLRQATPLVLERPVGPAREPLGARPQVRAQLQTVMQTLEAARGHCLALLDAAWDHVERDAGPVDEEPLRQASLAWARAAREAVDGVYPLCGLGAADPRTALNRAWRDLHTATQHALLL